jgi:hypothetical protein
MGEFYDHRPDATGETDALCRNVSATRTRSFLPRTSTRVLRRNLLDGAWESFTRTRFSWCQVVELLWVCLISAIQPEVVTGGLCYGAGLLGPTAELRHILAEMFEQTPAVNL